MFQSTDFHGLGGTRSKIAVPGELNEETLSEWYPLRDIACLLREHARHHVDGLPHGVRHEAVPRGRIAALVAVGVIAVICVLFRSAI